MRELIIAPNDAEQRVDKFLTKAVPTLPKNLLYKYLRLKRIKLNGKRCQPSDLLRQGDTLTLYINDDFFVPARKMEPIRPTVVDLRILYEDADILLIDKPPGLVVHQDDRPNADTLINAVKYYLFEKGEYLPEQEQSFTPALCNRIDRNTGGIVIAAKNAAALRMMNEKIRNREIRKFYLCLTEGVLPKKEGIIRSYLEKDTLQNKAHICSAQTPNSKEIVTKYRVLRSDDRHSMVEVELITGRSHQIRAQMAAIGHPLAGDTKYGGTEKRKFYPLYAYRIAFCFTTDAGILNHLNGKQFQVDQIWFENEIKREGSYQ